MKRKRHSPDDWQRMIVHDMKGPLAAILANLDLLSRCRLRAREEEFLRSALDGCRDLQRMVRGYLRIARLGEGGPDLELSVIPVARFFRRLEGSWSVLGRGKDVSLEFDLENAPAQLVADENLLERLLSNLVLNALAQVRQGGRIRIRAWVPSSGRVRISVADDGAGMPEDVKRALASPPPKGRKRTARGVGVGLSFCRLACALHGGSLRAEDAAPAGAVVTAELSTGLVPSGQGLLSAVPESSTERDHGIERS